MVINISSEVTSTNIILNIILLSSKILSKTTLTFKRILRHWILE